jgi:hypothetical protein
VEKITCSFDKEPNRSILFRTNHFVARRSGLARLPFCIGKKEAKKPTGEPSGLGVAAVKNRLAQELGKSLPQATVYLKQPSRPRTPLFHYIYPGPARART